MRRPGSATSLAVGFFVLVVVGLGVAAYFLADTQAEQRDTLRTRYADRTRIASNLLDSLFLVAEREQSGELTDRLGGDRVTRAQLDAHLREQGARWGVVLDGGGTVLA
ncbi:MAG TPA: hypothetical protein VN238_02010, partial [Solirubrobacteraceae bacterium]|nr:hypothetical protein [Solirubrobacteraceae bacterium]